MLVASDHEAVHPARRIVLVERDGARAIEQDAQDVARLDASQRSPDTVVDPTSERHVSTRSVTLEVDFVGSIEQRIVAVGRAPEQQHGRPRRNVDPAQSCVGRHRTHVKSER